MLNKLSPVVANRNRDQKPRSMEQFWGYIEGYYWKLMNWDDRKEIVSHLGKIGANSYLYAPKEDPLHRRFWRTEYSKSWMKDWKNFSAHCKKNGVQAIPGLAPGLSFDYTDEKDYQILLKKIMAFRDAGSETLALLMDDIPATLPKKSEGHFATLGEAHGELLLRLDGDLNDPDLIRPGTSAKGRGARVGKGEKGGKDYIGKNPFKLWFCPTIYTNQFSESKKGIAFDPYLIDLAATMPKEVVLMWTGPGIISEKIEAKSLKPLVDLFAGNFVIWDNYYANDYCPNKLFVGPYLGRCKEIWERSRGILLNPTGMPITDQFLMNLLAAHKGDAAFKAKTPLTSTSYWKKALEEFSVPSNFLKIAKFLDQPFYFPK